MSDISTKLTYLNETKTQLKDMINYGLDNNNKIDSNTTFRNYVSSLFKAFIESLNNPETLWGNLPKITGTGTNVTLNNTINAPMDIVLNPVELEQATTTGKNLLKMPNTSVTSNTVTSISNDGEIKVSGTPSQNWFSIIPTTNFNSSLPAGNYVFSRQNISTTARLILRLEFNDSTHLDYYMSTGSTQNVKITTSKEATGYSLYSDSNSTSTNLNFTDYLMLETGSTATTYEPYSGLIPAPNPDYPQQIHTISGDNEIVVSNKNLFDLTTAYHGTINAQGVEGPNESFRTSNYITTLPNTNYYFSTTQISGQTNKQIYIAYYDSSKTFISRDSYNELEHLFTTPANCVYMRAGVFTANQENVMLEKGTTATSYVEHKEQVKEINLPIENLVDFATLSNSNTTNSFTNDVLTVNTSSGTYANAFKDITTIYKSNSSKVLRFDFTSLNSTTALSGATGYVRLRIVKTDNSVVNVNLVDTSKNIENHTIPADVSDISTVSLTIYANNTASTITNTVTIDKPILHLGDKHNSYTPYGTTPIELCKIGDYEDKIDKSTGKNLFDKDNLTSKQNYVKNDSGAETSTQGFSYTTSYTNVKPNTQYTLSGDLVNSSGTVRVYYYNANKEWISRSSGFGANVNVCTFTTPNNCYYIQFQYINSVFNANTIIINEGSTALDYEPYGTKWYIKKNIGKVVLDGSESWFQSSNTNFYYYNDNIFPLSSAGSVIYPSKSNYYIADTYDRVYGGNPNYAFAFAYNVNRIALRNKDITTVADFKTWLGTHNTTVYYVLATPTYTLLNDTLQTQLNDIYNTMKSYKEQTNLSQVNNDLGFNLIGTAIEDIG